MVTRGFQPMNFCDKNFRLLTADISVEGLRHMIEIKSPKLRQLYDDWNSRRHGREFPARADFDPLELKYVLGSLSLVDVLRDPLRFRYRLHGSTMADLVGTDMTGRYLDEMADRRYYEKANTTFTKVVESGAPTGGSYRRFMTDRRTWDYDVLVLPLSSDDKTIDMLISCSIIYNLNSDFPVNWELVP
jgi:hypothetical protein